MDISDLIVFKAVVEHKGVTRAAEALHRVPSNVTARLKKLEAELNVNLFLREHNRLSVTSAGLRLLDYTDKILQLQKQAIAELTHQEPSGLFRLGSMESSAASRLPSLLTDYHTTYPQVQIELMTSASMPLIEKVLEGELDLAMVSDPPDDPRLICHPCYEEELVLIMPEAWLAREELPNTLTMVGYNKGCSYRHRLEKWLKRQARTCERVIEIPSHYTMLGCVIAGMGIGMVPKSLLALHKTDGLAYRQVDDDIAQATTYLVARKDNPTSAISAFVELATSVKKP
ncbi:LysR substrate-binding domain-containing protein [Marinomonas posidonica]|uniref:Transcriptional regulator, LysR family n=1 Tax=Marinomonas posidonica (strain CECT 7376 / NCIMB 14433 / IVIA-Po-181) TaxID=491952 RepID=F6CX27_MARPP|nr:LysR substrate-binding domain-containing protein [Marinomonas posidonica]AEF53281.1 transcriptional regulator, LysR family [Marinomonas posidonica IVIA-Po-181]